MLKTYFRNKYFIITGVLLLIAIPWIFFMLASASDSTNQTSDTIPSSPTTGVIKPTLAPKRQEGLNLIIPGKTIKEQVIQELGLPSEIKNIDIHEVFSYPLASTQRKNSIYLIDNTVKYIAEEIPEDNALYIQFLNQKSLNESELVLYDNYAGAGFFWQVFLTKGVAFLANPNNGYTIKVLYFEPMNYQSFLSTAGKTFSLSVTENDSSKKF